MRNEKLLRILQIAVVLTAVGFIAYGVSRGEVAVVLVGDEDATVKRFFSTNSTVTLMPQSTNPVHSPQIYDPKRTPIRVLGKVVEVKFSL